MKKLRWILAVPLALLACRAAPPPPLSGAPPSPTEAPPFAKETAEPRVLAPPGVMPEGAVVRNLNPPPELTLEEAFLLAEAHHPDLVVAAARVEAARGTRQQAGRRPNPEASITAESVPLDGGGLDEAELVIGVSQPLPIGGRLAAARDVADAEVRGAERDAEAVRLAVRSRIRGAFATMLYAQRATEARKELTDAVRGRLAVAEARIGAGDATPEEALRVKLELSEAAREERRAGALLAAAREELSLAVGAPEREIDLVTGDLDAAAELPAIEEVLRRLDSDPRLLAARAEVDAAEARVTRALAERIPDLHLDLFYRRIEATDENAFDVGIGIPLPLFDRRRGDVAAARARSVQSRAQLDSSRATLAAAARIAHERLRRARAEQTFLEAEVRPRTEELIELVAARFAAGDLSLDELLTARAGRVRVELASLEAFRETIAAWVELAPFLDR